MPLFGTDGARIGYEVHDGPTDAPPLILIHGFTASPASFVSNIPGLRERFKVITVELLGHGSSDAPTELAPYAPDAAVARLDGLFDHLGIETPLVCGHSLGGALALRFALDRPSRLSGLVVINSNSAAGTPEWRENARQNMKELAARVRAEGSGFMRTTRLYPAQSKRLPPEARRLLTEDFDRLRPEGIAGTAEGLTIAVNSFERLGELKTPTLVVIGDRDRDFVQNAPRFLVRMPSELVETFTIEGAGHAANLEQPEVFNRALFAFAERLGYIETGEAPPPMAPPLSVPDDSALLDPDGDEFGPTLYASAIGSLRAGGRQAFLAIAGSGLIVAGAALLIAAFLAGGDGDSGGRVAADVDAGRTSTPTPLAQAAGVRTAALPTVTLTPAVSASGTQPAAATNTQAAAAPATTTPTARPTATPKAQPTATPTAEPTVTNTPPPTPSPTPSGPSVSISGPSSGQPGSLLTFSVAESPAAITRTWSASNGASAAHSAAFSVIFSSPGCHSVSVTAIFPDGVTRSASRTIAVGVGSCS